jgi:hypothetical protein
MRVGRPVRPGSRPRLEQALLELNSSAVAAGVPRPASVPNLMPSVWDGKRCAYAAASQSFVCPPETFGDVTFASSLTLLGASGTPQSVFDSTTTAAVRFDATVTGTTTEGPAKFAVDVKQTLTLSGLITGTHVIDGSGTSRITGTVAPASTPIPFITTSTSTITRLVLPASDDADKWPLSGTIATESSTSLSGLPPVPSKVEVTFSGTSRAAVVVTVAGVTRHCTVDLASQGPSCG